MNRAHIAHQVARTPERFSRELGESIPSVRSSQAHIVPMDSQPSSHAAERVGAVIGGVAIALFLIAEKAGLL
jgi:hypothetical protein